MKRAIVRGGAALLFGLCLWGCDDTLKPFKESDYLYSIMGYLDASADTQYIRIMPLRQTVAYGSIAPLDATVTLTNLDNGTSEVLRDSVFTNIPSVHTKSLGGGRVIQVLESGDTTRHHNFWTTRKIIAGARYRLDVKQADGAIATGTVTIPKDYTVTVDYTAPGYIEVANVKLALVLLRAYTNCEPWNSYQYVYDTPVSIPAPVDGVYRVPLTIQAGSPPGCVLPIHFAGGPGLGGWFVVASDVDWPAGRWNIGWEFPVLDRQTNLTKAEGFFAGVLTKKLPTGLGCSLEPSTTPCRLTYNSESAVIVGRVTDVCGDVAPQGRVRLREIPKVAGAPVRVESGGTPTYRFQTLNPETRYEIRVSHPALRTLIPPFPSVYGPQELVDTILVGPGQTVTRNFSLQRLVPCGLDTTTNPL